MSPEIDPTLRRAIHDAADYLAASVGPRGRFVYRIHLDPDRRPRSSYNVLRHAGAVYAMAQHQARWPKPEVAAALGRATAHLWTYAGPADEGRGGAIDDPSEPLAIWSAKNDRMAKLGGAGLTLVALGELRTVAPALVNQARVARVAAFLRWMQKPDGSFFSKHYLDEGRSDRWVSLYYPGEAALGLVKIGGEANRRVARRALLQLARSRRGADRVPPDHWALLATGALLDGEGAPGEAASALRHHARQIVDSILATAPEGGDPSTAGGWGDGRTTPTATRLEGLIAALDYLDEPEDTARRAAMIATCRRGIAFLLRARIAEGPHRGAMPRSATWHGERPSSPRAGEVRIDYVQHALSAWIGWSERPEARPVTPRADAAG